MRKELLPLLGAEVFGDKRNDIVFLVVEVLVDATRESLGVRTLLLEIAELLALNQSILGSAYMHGFELPFRRLTT